MSIPKTIARNDFISRLTIDAHNVAAIRRSCQLAANVLRLGGSLVRPGITTDEIDRRLFNDIVKNGAYPSPLNYMGFSRAICTSVNNVIAHGIPDSRPLVEGDIINLDITVYREGFHGDTSCTFYVGGKDAVDEPGIKLVETTREALDAAISICGPQVPFREIGRVISQIARVNGYSVSEQLTGHGIGRNFHQAPLVFHHRNEEPEIMAPGMCFTIEPILCQGTAEGIQWPDGWTIATMDHGRSAQFEHTVLITEDGCEILTLPK
ncbi:methionine aminopeptidase [Ramicandelaber brevisporus]|nr:methionine aminopeptidase [Ramicandelaber brevisporus]